MDFTFTYPKDCSNAPKKETIKEMIHAFARKDPSQVSHYLSEDIQWQRVNHQSIIGKESLFHFFANTENNHVLSLHIERIITHGKLASADGTYTMSDGSTFSFCHIITFTSAGKNTINTVKTFLIKHD
ncbi:nuclear transport factor 2 family protein [Cytobacillus kochii]|uniref:nuclear transport factor 2 family protein n=1 Tax=Cytobacillus TaxID=2675230 RepID=UPI002E243EF5|nr:nuclear transport factor 2 family protein [Cytobacillus kochii]